MPRIAPLPADQAGPVLRAAYRYARRRFGAVPDPATVWARAPRVFWVWSGYESAVERSWHEVPPALAELAGVRTAAVIGCPWCLDFGSLMARQSGVREDQLRDLHDWRPSTAYDELERAVLGYADAMTTTPMTVADAMVAELQAALGAAGVVELTARIALENQRSRFNHALGITSQGFSSGTCALAAG